MSFLHEQTVRDEVAVILNFLQFSFSLHVSTDPVSSGPSGSPGGTAPPALGGALSLACSFLILVFPLLHVLDARSAHVNSLA